MVASYELAYYATFEMNLSISIHNVQKYAIVRHDEKWVKKWLICAILPHAIHTLLSVFTKCHIRQVFNTCVRYPNGVFVKTTWQNE